MLLHITSLTCVVLLVLVSLVRCQDAKLKTIDLDCTRQCDSHFSGPECWSKSLGFYSNDLMRSIVLYKNAITQAKADESVLMEKAYKAIQKYIDIDSNLAQFIFSNPVNVTQEVVKQLIDMIPNANNGRQGECPKQCEEKPLVLWRSLYGVFMGLSLGTLIFLIAYTVLLKIQFNKFNQKLTSSSLNNS